MRQANCRQSKNSSQSLSQDTDCWFWLLPQSFWTNFDIPAVFRGLNIVVVMKKSERGVLVYSGRCKPSKLANHHPLETETRMHLVVVGHQSHICNCFAMWDTVHKTHHKYSHFQPILDRGVTLVACPSFLSCTRAVSQTRVCVILFLL